MKSEYKKIIKEKNFFEISKILCDYTGLSSQNLPFTKIIHLIKISLYLVKNKGTFLIGENGTGKSYIFTKYLNEIYDKYSGNITPAMLIGDAKGNPKDSSCMLDKKALLIEEIGDDDESGETFRGIFKDSLESGKFKKCKKELKDVDVSIVLTGNYYSPILKFEDLIQYKKAIPLKYLDKGLLDRFPLLIPHNNEIFGEVIYHSPQEKDIPFISKLLEELRSNLEIKDYISNDMKIQNEREKEIYNRFLNALSILFYLEKVPPKWFIEGWFEMLKFFRSLLIEEKIYNPFNKNSARLIVELLGYELDTVHCAIYTDNRIIIKLKNKDIAHKIALTGFGIQDNRKEYEFYKYNPSTLISSILDNNNFILSQKINKLNPNFSIYFDTIDIYNNNFKKTDEAFNASMLSKIEQFADCHIPFNANELYFRGIPEYYKNGLKNLIFNTFNKTISEDEINLKDFTIENENFKILNFSHYL